MRSTMTNLVEELRGLVAAGTGDYTIGTSAYWSDDQLQDALDHARTIYDYEPMDFFPQRAGSVYNYKLYFTGVQKWEGTCTVTDNLGSALAGTAFTFDPFLGQVNFAVNQWGSARLITGTAFNVNAAAAYVWNKKAAYYAGAYDVSTDNHNLKRSQLVAQARQQAQYFGALGNPNIFIERADTNASCE